MYIVDKSIWCFTLYWYWYWVLVLGWANTIGYWILGALLGIVLALFVAIIVEPRVIH